jgi:hypothetical protein
MMSAAVGADERREYADRAMATLRSASAAGSIRADALQSDPSFVPLHSRPDFQLLLMDLAMPADPFARGD